MYKTLELTPAELTALKMLHMDNDELSSFTETISDSDKQKIGRIMDGYAASAGKLSEYLDWRGGMGCGDHGHDKALKKAIVSMRKIRRALGYTYP